jgi:hypothetical protein
MPVVAKQKMEQFQSLELAKRLIHDVFLVVLIRVVVIMISASDFYTERRNVLHLTN